MDKFIESYYWGTVFARPDASGIRGKGLNRKNTPGGGDDYPYDKKRTYGAPAAYGRANAGHGGSHRNVPTPKDAQDIERWQDDIEEGDDGWLDGTPRQGNIVKNPGAKSKFGEDDVEEALGTPYNAAKGGAGTGGQHTGGRVMPGTSGQWGGRPKGRYWDNAIDDEELDLYGEFSSGIPFASNLRARGTPRDHRAEKDGMAFFQINIPDDIHYGIEHDYDDDDFEKFLQSRYKAGMGDTMKHSRYTPGFTWKESKKRGLVGEFLTEESKKQKNEDDNFEDLLNNMYESVLK